jgi:hypothetical protein
MLQKELEQLKIDLDVRKALLEFKNELEFLLNQNL